MSTETPSFLIDAQLALVTSILDRIVPPEGEKPGAGQLGVAEYLDRVVGVSARLKKLFTRGLAQIEIISHGSHSSEFADLSAEQRDAVLSEVESAEPEFFEALVRQTYNGYYADSSVLELLGLEARPPQPRGYDVPPGGMSLLENVKKRGKVYRDV